MTDSPINRTEQLARFIIKKYCTPAANCEFHEQLKEYCPLNEEYMKALEEFVAIFDDAAFEKKVDVMLELISFLISARKVYLEEQIKLNGNADSPAVKALMTLIKYTHDVGSRESLGNLLESLNKLK